MSDQQPDPIAAAPGVWRTALFVAAILVPVALIGLGWESIDLLWQRRSPMMVLNIATLVAVVLGLRWLRRQTWPRPQASAARGIIFYGAAAGVLLYFVVPQYLANPVARPWHVARLGLEFALAASLYWAYNAWHHRQPLRPRFLDRAPAAPGTALATISSPASVALPSGGGWMDRLAHAFGPAPAPVAPVMDVTATPGNLDVSESGTHGTAAFDPPSSLVREKGVILGRTELGGGELLRWDQDGHLVTVAPTRKGKGTKVIIPNLLTHPGNAVVTDVKGTNALVTARARRAMGHAVHVADPFGWLNGYRDSHGLDNGARFNPLDEIPDAEADSAYSASAALASMMCMDKQGGGGGGTHEHFREQAVALMMGLILHVCASADPKDRHLPYVRHLLTLPPEPADPENPRGDSFRELLEKMATSRAAHGQVAAAANTLIGMADRERGSVVSSAKKYTRWLGDPQIARTLASSTIRMADLRNRKTTVYLVLPPKQLRAYAEFFRVMIWATRAVFVNTPERARRGCRLYLDEFRNLGRLDEVQEGFTLDAEFRLSYWIFVQGLYQLEEIYDDAWETFLGNAGLLQAFSVADKMGCTHLSEKLGKRTIRIVAESENEGTSRGQLKPIGQVNAGTGTNTSETGRELMTPDEIRRMAEGSQLLFLRDGNPVIAATCYYFRDPEFAGLFDPNPFFSDEGDDEGEDDDAPQLVPATAPVAALAGVATAADDTAPFGYEPDDEDEAAPAPAHQDDDVPAQDEGQRVSALGKYAHIPGSSEDFMRRKQEEIDLEDGDWRPANGDEDYSGSPRAPIEDDEELPDV